MKSNVFHFSFLVFALSKTKYTLGSKSRCQREIGQAVRERLESLTEWYENTSISKMEFDAILKCHLDNR